MKLSVIIITFNEEQNIERALKSVDFADEVILVDSFSHDRTQEIARSYNAVIIEKEFMGYGQQKNFALSHCQGEWVLWLDADEQVDEELKAEILKTINNPQAKSLYEITRKTNFLGKWIYHGGWYPDIICRLFKRNQAKFTEPPVHEKLVSLNNDSPGRLKGHINHYSFPTIKSQIQTNLKYAELGSKELVKQNKSTKLKCIYKPMGKFIECYFIKLGFLDGIAGFIIAINAAHSLFMKYTMAYFEDGN